MEDSGQFSGVGLSSVEREEGILRIEDTLDERSLADGQADREARFGEAARNLTTAPTAGIGCEIDATRGVVTVGSFDEADIGISDEVFHMQATALVLGSDEDSEAEVGEDKCIARIGSGTFGGFSSLAEVCKHGRSTVDDLAIGKNLFHSGGWIKSG